MSMPGRSGLSVSPVLTTAEVVEVYAMSFQKFSVSTATNANSVPGRN
jgi:hypothetical protein